MPQVLLYFLHISAAKAETYGKSLINFSHGTVVKAAHVLFKPLFIYSANLFKQHYGIFCKSAALGRKLDVSRKVAFVFLACYCRGNNGRAVFVANIVLYNKNGAHAALFRADNWT